VTGLLFSPASCTNDITPHGPSRSFSKHIPGTQSRTWSPRANCLSRAWGLPVSHRRMWTRPGCWIQALTCIFLELGSAYRATSVANAKVLASDSCENRLQRISDPIWKEREKEGERSLHSSSSGTYRVLTRGSLTRAIFLLPAPPQRLPLCRGRISVASSANVCRHLWGASSSTSFCGDE
jgi:hypothetical protein